MNKSLARDNKSQDRGQSAPASDGSGSSLLLPLKNFSALNQYCPLSLICRMSPSHRGSDEQAFGAKQQVLHEGKGDPVPGSGDRPAGRREVLGVARTGVITWLPRGSLAYRLLDRPAFG